MKPVWESYVIYDFNFTTFWKKAKTIEMVNRPVVATGFTGQECWMGTAQGSRTLPCNTVMADIWYHMFVKTHRTLQHKGLLINRLTT